MCCLYIQFIVAQINLEFYILVSKGIELLVENRSADVDAKTSYDIYAVT